MNVNLDTLERELLAEVSQLEAEIDSKEPEVIDIVDWAEAVSGNSLDVWQKKFLRSGAHHFLLNCSRQVGKTEAVALRATYRAIYLNRREVCLAPSLFQSSKIRRRALNYIKSDGVRIITKSAFELQLENGGAILTLPGDRPDVSVRGETTDDLIVDEASRVKDSLIAAATPTTATRLDATITYLSTPAGKRGEFYRAWTDKSSDWEKITITADQCPRITHKFLEKERKRLGPVLFSQEYECQFIADSNALLDFETIQDMFRLEVPDASKLNFDIFEKPLEWPDVTK
jgi:Terminase large subunit, T4likevirus-type, N-terminal